MAQIETDYDRGYAAGESLKEMRAEGIDYDIRWDLADEAKSNRGGFDEYMRGLNDAMQAEGS